MKLLKIAGLFLSWIFINIPAGLSLTSTEGSAEDVYWSAPMTVHDYEKNTDLHNIALSSLSMIELEFIRLGDGLLNFTTQSNKSPISRSMDAVEHAYSKLPQIKPVRRFGQLWDALQLRQLSLSDARTASSILFADPYGGVTSMMQVRANKLIIFVEDTLYDVDSGMMLPLNWSLSSLRDKPTKIKSLAFVADGLGALRREVFKTLSYLDHKIVQLGSDFLFGIKKIQDTFIRHKREKKYGHLWVYAKMPLSVFEENRSCFEDNKKNVFAGTVSDWRARLLRNPKLLPDNIQQADPFFLEARPSQSPPREVIVITEYRVWEKVPRELKKYVITFDEVAKLVYP
ncbi:MAG: hypothetical protein WC484_04440 [Candidatus Omnitrophota bacterium]